MPPSPPSIPTNVNLTMSPRQFIDTKHDVDFPKSTLNIESTQTCTHTQCHAMFLYIQMHDANAFTSCDMNIYNYMQHNHFTDGFTSYAQFACYSISSNNTQIYSTQGLFSVRNQSGTVHNGFRNFQYSVPSFGTSKTATHGLTPSKPFKWLLAKE